MLRVVTSEEVDDLLSTVTTSEGSENIVECFVVE